MQNRQNIQIEEDEIDLGQLFRTLKKGFITILLITFLVTLASALYSYFLPHIYSSDVKISFSDEESSSMSSMMMPDALSAFGGVSEKKLETVKLTLETRDFINSVINEMQLSQRYFIEHFYRKNEVYEIEALDIFLDIHDDKLQEREDETLYDTFFAITPINNREFILTIEALDYNRTCSFNRTIRDEYFSIKVTKKHPLAVANYYVKKSNPELISDNILSNLKTNILSDTILQLTYTDTIKRRAKEVVEEIAKKFREVTLVKKTSELKKRLSFLNNQIGVIEKQLQGEGKNLKDYQKKSQALFTTETNNKIILEKLSEKKELVKKFKLQLEELNNFQHALESGNLNTVSLFNSGINISSMKALIELFHATNIELSEMQLQAQNPEKALTKRPQLERLIEQLQEEKSRLSELTFNFTPTHPEVIEANEKIMELEEKIHAYIQTDLQRLQDSLSSLQEKILTNILTTKATKENKLKLFKDDIKNEYALIQNKKKKSLTIQELKRKFVLSENIYTFLLQKKMETEMSLASIIQNTQIIESAREALKPIKPNRKLIVIVGFITGVILAIFYVLLRAMMDTKIRNEADVKELTNLPLYGALPNKKDKRFFDEAIRNIRTNLQFVIPNEKKSIAMLISSTIGGEGKTTIIANLAESLSQINKRVLMMDLDLRKPRLYQELKMSNKVGMTQYLAGSIELDESILKVHKSLDFFPAGAVPPNPSELLMSDKFKETLEELFSRYDYIFFDTSPIGSVIDAKILLPYSDIVLLVVRANVAEKGFVEHCQELKDKANIKSAGIILNDVKHEKSGSYGYGYGYGYGV